jgi:3-hydroxyisobutyrate dehydrogenase-like beta-hydroxyacid dehydrogenase
MAAPITPPATVGFVGLGIMGQGQASNLLSAGFNLVVWTRDGAKASALAAAHPPGRVRVASSAREVVEQCELTWAMLSTLEASKAVFEAADGMLAGVSPGRTIVDCATLTPERMSAMAAMVRGAGGAFLEAPVSGSKKPAADGQLVFLCAGDQSALEAATPGLDAMGKATHYYGEEVGVGTRMKLVVNMVMGAQLAALGEGIALCEAAGLDSANLVTVLGQGAMASPMIALKGPAMAARAYPPAFPLCHAQKDLRFALNLATDLHTALPVASAANGLFEKAIAAGHTNDDFAAVAEAARSPSEGAAGNGAA